MDDSDDDLEFEGDIVIEDEEDDEDLGKGKKRAADDSNKTPNKKKKLSSATPGIDEIQDDIDVRKKKKGRRGPRPKLSPELARKMGEANMAYVNREYSEAVRLLKEVVKHAPHVADPYHTLGLIYEDIGDKKNSLNFFMIAAHVTPNDQTLWKRLAIMSRELGNGTQAIYCYTKAIKLDPDDLDSVWDRAIIYAEQSDTKKAIEGFLYLSERQPENADVIKELARVYAQSSHPEKAIELLEDKLNHGLDDLNIVNILCELLIGKGEYQKGVELVNKVAQSHDNELPIDLRINQAICLVYLRNIESSERYMELLQHKDVAVYGDLYFNLAEAYFSVGESTKALALYKALNHNSTYNHPLILLKQGMCLRLLRQIPQAIAVFEEVIEKVPGHVDAMLALSEMYKEQGMASKALQLLEQHTAHTEQEMAIIPSSSSSSSASSSSAQTLAHITDSTPTPSTAQDLRLIVEKGLILYGFGKYAEFLDICLPIFSVPVPVRTEKKRGRKPMEWRRRQREKASHNTDSFFELSGKKKPRKKPNDVSHPRPQETTPPPDDPHSQQPPSQQPPTQQQPSVPLTQPSQPSQPPQQPAPLPSSTALPTHTTLDPSSSHTTHNPSSSSHTPHDPPPPPPPTILSTADAMDIDQPPTSIDTPSSVQKKQTTQQATTAALNKKTQADLKRAHKEKKRMMSTTVARTRRKRYGRGSYLSDILGEELYTDVVTKTCKVLAYFDRYAEAADIIHDALTNVTFADKSRAPTLKFLAVGIAFNNDNFESALDSVKYVCTQRPYSIPIWNLYNKMMIKTGTFPAHNKFMTRLLLKHGTSVPLMVLVGHACFVAGSLRLALGEYFVAYCAMPDEPVLSLCIGLAYLHQIMNRRLPDRHHTALRAFTFLFRYFELRGKNQEGCYNIARAFHHLGLKHLAVPFYEKVLKISDEGGLSEEHDLKREAAYNLSLIYSQSGSHHLATQILAKYITI